MIHLLISLLIPLLMLGCSQKTERIEKAEKEFTFPPLFPTPPVATPVSPGTTSEPPVYFQLQIQTDIRENAAKTLAHIYSATQVTAMIRSNNLFSLPCFLLGSLQNQNPAKEHVVSMIQACLQTATALSETIERESSSDSQPLLDITSIRKDSKKWTAGFTDSRDKTLDEARAATSIFKNFYYLLNRIEKDPTQWRYQITNYEVSLVELANCIFFSYYMSAHSPKAVSAHHDIYVDQLIHQQNQFYSRIHASPYAAPVLLRIQSELVAQNDALQKLYKQLLVPTIVDSIIESTLEGASLGNRQATQLIRSIFRELWERDLAISSSAPTSQAHGRFIKEHIILQSSAKSITRLLSIRNSRAAASLQAARRQLSKVHLLVGSIGFQQTGPLEFIGSISKISLQLVKLLLGDVRITNDLVMEQIEKLKGVLQELSKTEQLNTPTVLAFLKDIQSALQYNQHDFLAQFSTIEETLTRVQQSVSMLDHTEISENPTRLSEPYDRKQKQCIGKNSPAQVNAHQLTQEFILSCMTHFHGRTLNLALNPIVSGKDYELLPQSLERLAHPTENLFGLLPKLLKEQTGQNFSNLVPNPYEWATGVQDYLIASNLRKEIGPKKEAIESMIRVGESAQNILQLMSKKESWGALLQRFLEQSKRVTESLDQKIHEYESKFLHGVDIRRFPEEWRINNRGKTLMQFAEAMGATSPIEELLLVSDEKTGQPYNYDSTYVPARVRFTIYHDRSIILFGENMGRFSLYGFSGVVVGSSVIQSPCGNRCPAEVVSSHFARYANNFLEAHRGKLSRIYGPDANLEKKILQRITAYIESHKQKLREYLLAEEIQEMEPLAVEYQTMRLFLSLAFPHEFTPKGALGGFFFGKKGIPNPRSHESFVDGLLQGTNPLQARITDLHQGITQLRHMLLPMIDKNLIHLRAMLD